MNLHPGDTRSLSFPRCFSSTRDRSGHPQTMTARAFLTGAFKREGGKIFEAPHVARDSTAIPVEVIARAICISAQDYVWSTARSAHGAKTFASFWQTMAHSITSATQDRAPRDRKDHYWPYQHPETQGNRGGYRDTRIACLIKGVRLSRGTGISIRKSYAHRDLMHYLRQRSGRVRW